MKENETTAKPSLKLQAYQYLKTKILNCEYAPSQFLNEQKLCAEMGNISRTPMRDALGRLEQEGLITILPKKGLMVSPITDGICGNCFLKLTPQTMTHARRGAVTECDHCRHLVYLEDL